ncbi:MAG: hypothetical protein M1831_003521 [Alyxoria varia]|nr:MAG: hypothetical protein M1831_003521 [Alyxoria varia]
MQTLLAMARYETRTLHEVRLLEEQIKQDSQSDKASPVTTLFGWFGFDVMGDVVFGRSFGMLQKREWHTVIQRLGEALGLLGPFSPTPWIVHLGFRLGAGWIPMVRKWEGMIEWCRVQIEKKGKGQIGDQDPDHEDEPGNQNIAEKIDVGTYLTEDARKNGYTKSDWYWLTGDANLAIVAGSDTVTSTLIGLFYRLASNPDVSSKLYSELTANNTPVDDDKALAKLPYLKGIINEALRLHPALLTGGYRKTPKEGIVIGDQYIPGETNIIAPRWCIFRREDCFEDAESFVPERWCEKPEMVKNRTCYVPFGTGKSVAMMELRLVTANLVHKYRIGFADETAKTRFPASVRDCFTARMGPLDLRFERREGVGSET